MIDNRCVVDWDPTKKKRENLYQSEVKKPFHVNHSSLFIVSDALHSHPLKQSA